MSYGCNDNQNYFMEEGRTTSRVTNNPGGKSTICLGWDTNGSDDVDDVGTTTRRFRKREFCFGAYYYTVGFFFWVCLSLFREGECFYLGAV
mmetsp:Transcript_6595/g.9969  ORF Transcript_6595/g.9969 Transcript_6595/m.9969 type:complete len:91 (+) Transcript_6595:210-482(+)